MEISLKQGESVIVSLPNGTILVQAMYETDGHIVVVSKKNDDKHLGYVVENESVTINLTTK